MNAVIYARYSSDKQRKESIDDQVRVCKEFAAREGYEVVHIYADEAQSGTSDKRDNFQKMIADSENKNFKSVIVYKLDRFARDRYAAALYRKKLADNGVSIISATENIPNTPEGVLLESLLEGMAGFYSAQLAQNVIRGMEGNARKCLANGATLYGYNIVDGRYVINEREANFIRKAFEMRADGYIIGAIATELHEAMGVPYKRAYNIFHSAFKNEKYTGVYVWGNIRIEDGMPAIIDREQFLAVQAMKGHKRVKSRKVFYPLTGRIFDSEGNRWFGASARGRSDTYLYYANGKERIRKEKLESCIYESLREALKEQSVRNDLILGIIRESKEIAGTPSRPSSQARKELNNLLDVAHKIGMDDILQRKISEARAELKEIEYIEKQNARSEAFTPEAVGSWLDWYVSQPSNELLETFVHSVFLRMENGEMVECLAFFTWQKTSEPPNAERFASVEFGTPKKIFANHEGFYLRVA